MRSLLFLSFLFLLSYCTPSRKIGATAEKTVIRKGELAQAHIGISVYEPATGKWWYNYQGDKFFVPASNTKLPTLYAALKWLGDSLPGLRVTESATTVLLEGTGDPTLLHEDYPVQPVFRYLKSLAQSPKTIFLGAGPWKTTAWGSGWSWTDYDAAYMAERSALPVYGNVVSFTGTRAVVQVNPRRFADSITGWSQPTGSYINDVKRPIAANQFSMTATGTASKTLVLPFVTSPLVSWQLLQDTLQFQKPMVAPGAALPLIPGNEKPLRYTIHSQPTDSMLRPMMHRSDNFFAEQSLLMASNQVLGVMNERQIIDTLLKTDFANLPQPPRWVDGSGLSRYNLFTPQDMVAILGKLKDSFGMQRLQVILPTGDDGTLTNYYKSLSGKLFAKTGTLSGVVALSGFLYTTHNRLLIFSVLVNNHQTSATAVRRAVEQFIMRVQQQL